MDNTACITEADYQENLRWAARSYMAAMRGEPVPCKGCEKTFPLHKVFRCYHCGSYFCPNCARGHFGEHHGHLFEVMKQPGQVVCMDLDCQSRADCDHAEPHEENGECSHVCGADEPCSRCRPVEEMP